MFVPFIFTLDMHNESDNYFHWRQFYKYADACIENNWPIISHERYFERFSNVEDTVFGVPLEILSTVFFMKRIPTSEQMHSIKKYSISQEKEDVLISNYSSQLDCWIDLLRNDNLEFEQIIGEVLDRLICDLGETPEGILVYEFFPKALVRAANTRNIPVVFQAGGIVRPPFATALNGFSIVNDNSFEHIKIIFDEFMSQKKDIPILSHKGLLRLFISPQYISDVHNIESEPEYDMGVLHNNMQTALFHLGNQYLSDQELSDKAREKFSRVLVRTRPGENSLADALDDSPTCFHFCCKCERILGLATKGMFEVMLAGRIPHEYGTSIFHSFCNSGLEDFSKNCVPIEFLNFIMFGLCTPYEWITNQEYLQSIVSSPSVTELYMRSFSYFTRNISKQDLEFYYMTSGREYRIGDTLYLTKDHLPHQYASYYCKQGLYVPEGTHTWSEGEKTEFEFDLLELPDSDLIITIALYSLMYETTQTDSLRVRCEVNGQSCGEINLTYNNRYLQFIVPKEYVACKMNLILNYDAPQVIKTNDGDLYFALAFEAIRISKVIESPYENALIFQEKMMKEQNGYLQIQNGLLLEQQMSLQSSIGVLQSQLITEQSSNQALKAQLVSLNESYEIARANQVRLEEEQKNTLAENEAIKNEILKMNDLYEASKIGLSVLKEEQCVLLKENENLSSELTNILESKAYRHIVKPIWEMKSMMKKTKL